MLMSIMNLQAGDLTRLVLLTVQAGEYQQPQRGRAVPTGHEVFITCLGGGGRGRGRGVLFRPLIVLQEQLNVCAVGEQTLT